MSQFGFLFFAILFVFVKSQAQPEDSTDFEDFYYSELGMNGTNFKIQNEMIDFGDSNVDEKTDYQFFKIPNKIVFYDNETCKLTTFKIPEDIKNDSDYEEWLIDNLPERGTYGKIYKWENVPILESLSPSRLLYTEKNVFEAPETIIVNAPDASWNTILVPNELENSFRLYQTWLLNILPEGSHYMERYKSGEFSDNKSQESLKLESNYRNLSKKIYTENKSIFVEPHSIRVDFTDDGWKTIEIPSEAKESAESFQEWVDTLPKYKSYELYIGWIKDDTAGSLNMKSESSQVNKKDLSFSADSRSSDFESEDDTAGSSEMESKSSNRTKREVSFSANSRSSTFESENDTAGSLNVNPKSSQVKKKDLSFSADSRSSDFESENDTAGSLNVNPKSSQVKKKDLSFSAHPVPSLLRNRM